MTNSAMSAGAAANRVAQTVHGIISAVDPVNHAVKVMLQPENIESGWIPDAACTQVGDLRISCPSSIGTHVILQPIEGDGEHLTVIGVVYDAVVMPPISPATGRVAQPGEILVMAGCGTPPGPFGGTPGNASPQAGWWHLTAVGLFSGAGNVACAMENTAMTWRVGAVTMSLSASGLSIEGGGVNASGDVTGQSHSLARHVHMLGSNTTGSAVG